MLLKIIEADKGLTIEKDKSFPMEGKAPDRLELPPEAEPMNKRCGSGFAFERQRSKELKRERDLAKRTPWDCGKESQSCFQAKLLLSSRARELNE